MEKLPDNVKDLRSFIRTKSKDRILEIMSSSGLSKEEIDLVLLRYKDKYSLTKVAYLRNTNASSVSRKCSRALQQILDYFVFSNAKNSHKIENFS